MDFAGMQSLTLLDFPGKVACILFVRGCNLRCPFCHNAALVRPGAESPLSDADILSFLTKRQGLLDGVVISGGEPLMYPELVPFLQKVRALGYSIKVAFIKACVETDRIFFHSCYLPKLILLFHYPYCIKFGAT